eukprot:scaffold353_cov185-Amphora_coffeaeformis.AAC.4
MSTIEVSGADDDMRCAKDRWTNGVADRNARVMEENIKHAKIMAKSESLMWKERFYLREGRSIVVPLLPIKVDAGTKLNNNKKKRREEERRTVPHRASCIVWGTLHRRASTGFGDVTS